MGCLNSDGQFDHWFANIHLSGPCNRSCYFCIGQHMMGLDDYNSLSVHPLKMDGFEQFLSCCKERGIREVNLTGTNTEPLLYDHHHTLVEVLREELDHPTIGIRSNGTLVARNPEVWRLYDKASVTLCSADPEVYREMMGQGEPPDLAEIVRLSGDMDLKVNCVLGPDNVDGDVLETIGYVADCGIPRMNIREPYGQPRVGNPFSDVPADGEVFGNPVYEVCGVEVAYWDVHYTEVESVNLYANGRVSMTYPVTKGHSEDGEVQPQEQFDEHGRHRDQWV